MNESSKYLIIGNGIAGLSAAKTIRNNDKNGSITMISNEPYLSYYRMKLTEELATYSEDEAIYVNKPSWYDKNHIDVNLNRNVVKIDDKNNMVTLENNQNICYEKLLIATGGIPFVPSINGSNKMGVFTLRNINNLKSIRNYIKDIDAITVIGGGLLGIEAAWSLKLLGKKVTLIEFAPYLLNRQLDEDLGYKLKKEIEKQGIEVYLPKAAEEVIGKNKVEKLRLSTGDIIETQAILISSGVRPNLELVRNSSIRYDKGIIVDKYLKTNIDNIYAAGDVIEYENRVYGLWTASNQQGKVAGNNMSGLVEEYTNPSTYTSLRVGEIKVFSIGDVKYYDNVYDYKENEDIHHKLFVKNKLITGAILFGDLKEQNSIRAAVTNNESLENYLEHGIKFR